MAPEAMTVVAKAVAAVAAVVAVTAKALTVAIAKVEVDEALVTAAEVVAAIRGRDHSG